MADGSTDKLSLWGRTTGTVETATLGQVLGAGSRLVASCRCGREAAIDAGLWVRQGLSAAPLRSLEGRLRCVCGARRATLAAGSEAPASPGASASIFPFR